MTSTFFTDIYIQFARLDTPYHEGMRGSSLLIENVMEQPYDYPGKDIFIHYRKKNIKDARPF